jgi:NAD(P)-dependent dehydrogenase (short-subunit alcohol dehydrogenase family)
MTNIAVVTGAASGIGLALSRALVHRGVDVALVDRNPAVLATAATLTGEGPATATAAVVDVTDASAVGELIASTHERYGRLDLVFNTAGIGMGGEPEELSLAHWQRAIDINLRGVIHGCHAAYPLMKRQGFGRIVNTASLAGLGPGLGTAAPYNATKHGVVGLSLSLRSAGADFGVGVHVVCPGVVDTPILDGPDEPGLQRPASLVGVDVRAMLRDVAPSRPYPPERFARDVLRGIARNRAIIVVPRQAAVSWLLLRLSPRLADALSLRLTRIGRKHSAPAARASDSSSDV